MTDAPLVVDVVDPRLWRGADAGGLAVLVEPLYGCVAVAAALDAGWGSVELAGELSPDAAPIPLVSFEQPPAREQRGARCRVRSSDLAAAATLVPGALLGSPAVARPLCARLAATATDRVTFLPVLSHGETAADAWWAAGMLVRVLLDELELRDATLTDAAGMCVALATSADDVAAQLIVGARWRRHLERGGHEDDLRVAAAVDSLAIVPELALDDDALFARPW